MFPKLAKISKMEAKKENIEAAIKRESAKE